MKSKEKKYSRKKTLFLFVAPALIIYAVYFIFPTCMAIVYSLTDYKGTGNAEFVGLQNFIIMFTKDSFFWKTVKNTAIIGAFGLVFTIPFSFVIALIVNKQFPGTTVLKGVYFSPMLVAPVTAALVWLFILDPYSGLLNTVLRNIGLDALALQWVGGLKLTPYSAGIVNTWKFAGFYMCIFLSGLKSISQEVYDSATVDGASGLTKVFRITIPLLFQTNKTILIFAVTEALRSFDLIYTMTNGAPYHASDTMISYMYTVTFTNRRYGFGMAIVVFVFAISLTFSLLIMRLMRKDITD